MAQPADGEEWAALSELKAAATLWFRSFGWNEEGLAVAPEPMPQRSKAANPHQSELTQ